MKTARPDRLPETNVEDGAQSTRTHETLVLAGCMVHSRLDEAGLTWLSQILRCIRDVPDPPAGTFDNLDMTMQVVTFDDIDTCTNLVTRTLGLSPIASIGFRELLVNAVEHGNLGITFDDKTALLETGRWQDEIEKRLKSEAYRDRFASVSIRRDGSCFTIVIQDQGDGFDWENYLEARDTPSTMLHGRGLSLAMSAEFAAVQYRGTGSEVYISGVSDQS